MHKPSLKASTVMIGVKGRPCTYFCKKSMFSEDRIFQQMPWATELVIDRTAAPACATWRWTGNSIATRDVTTAVTVD